MTHLVNHSDSRLPLLSPAFWFTRQAQIKSRSHTLERKKWRATQWRHRAKEIDGLWGHREISSASSTASKIVTPCSTAEEARRGCDAIHAHQQQHHHDHLLALKANHSWQEPTKRCCVERPIAGFEAGLRVICNKPDGETDVDEHTDTPSLCWHLPQGERGAAATAMQCLSACTSWCLALLGPT